MRISLGALRNVAGLLLGVGFGLILMSPTVSALSMIPGLSLFAPTHNSNVSGAITFFAAADGEGLVSLQFKVDGADYGSPITAGSCRATFDTRSTGDGPHTIQAVGQDEFGNTVFTPPSTIFVNNTAPAISNVGVSNVTSSSASINWATAVAADGRVDYGTSMSYGGSAYDTNVNTSHSVTLTGLSAGTTYHFSATSFGQNGILSSSGDFVFTTAGAPPVPTPTPAPTPTPNPNPTPSPTPVVPSPTPTPGGPTPTPTPIGPTPTPTPIGPTPTPVPTPVPTPIAPLPSPSPSPTATYDGGTRGRTAPTASTNVGSAVPRTDGTFAPDPSTITGQATTRGAAAKATVAPSTTVVSRGTGVSVSNTVVVNPGTGSGGGQSLSYAMFMPGASTGMSNTQQRSTLPQNQTQTQSQTQTRASKTSTDTPPAYKPCVGPNPFANEPDGAKCIDGTWIRNEPDAATTTTTTAATTDPATTTATAGTSVSSVVSAPSVSGSSSATSGGSVTSATLTSGSSSATSVKIKPSACSTPDPYAAKGGVGICVNGDWVLLWMPKKGK